MMDSAREILTMAAECATEWALVETSTEHTALLRCEGGGTVVLFGRDAVGWTAKAGAAERHAVARASGWKALLQVLEKARHDTPEVRPLLTSAWRVFKRHSKEQMRRDNEAQARAALSVAWPGSGDKAAPCESPPGEPGEIATLVEVGGAGIWLEPLGSGWMCEIHAGGGIYRALPADLSKVGSVRAALAAALVQALGDPGLPEDVSAELLAGLTRLREAGQMDAAAKAEDGSV